VATSINPGKEFPIGLNNIAKVFAYIVYRDTNLEIRLWMSKWGFDGADLYPRTSRI